MCIGSQRGNLSLLELQRDFTRFSDFMSATISPSSYLSAHP